MTGDAKRDAVPTPHHWGGSDEIPEDEYAQHAREEREAEQRGRMDAAHEQAKAEKERCGRPLKHWEDLDVTTPCGRPSGHEGRCHPVPLAVDEEDGDA